MLYIRFGSFFVLRGILLSVGGGTIRVALEDCGDAAEFRRADNGWISENGDPVEIELRQAHEEESSRFPLTPAPDRPAAHHCVV
jgi:hypothetical protein